MTALTFQIISDDRGIFFRWQKAFKKEGWPVMLGSSCVSSAPNCETAPAISLIESSVPECRTREDFKAFLKKWRPMSALVFGDPRTISNVQIAEFLEAGADDFIYKDMDERVLVAKLKAHLRRLSGAISAAADSLTSSCGGLQIEKRRRAVKLKAARGKNLEVLNLTQKEMEILVLLVGNEKSVITRETMLNTLWGDNAENVYSECIDKHVESLRRKLGLYGKRIKTVYGAGYMFTSENNIQT